jgi:TPR repeat protein
MIRSIKLAAILALPLVLAHAMAADEDSKTRLDNKEIMEQMIQSARMPAQQQNEKLGLILKNQSDSKTPRSDFLFCTGLAYWGNHQAQACVGKAYESGIGVVEDLIEAYVWYSLAQEKSSDQSSNQNSQDYPQHLKEKLQTAYPFPSDDDLDNQLKAQQNRIKQFQSDLRKKK